MLNVILENETCVDKKNPTDFHYCIAIQLETGWVCPFWLVTQFPFKWFLRQNDSRELLSPWCLMWKSWRFFLHFFLFYTHFSQNEKSIVLKFFWLPGNIFGLGFQVRSNSTNLQKVLHFFCLSLFPRAFDLFLNMIGRSFIKNGSCCHWPEV